MYANGLNVLPAWHRFSPLILETGFLSCNEGPEAMQKTAGPLIHYFGIPLRFTNDFWNSKRELLIRTTCNTITRQPNSRVDQIEYSEPQKSLDALKNV